ncbi:hypothetical protein LA080_008357 [Diaporthe eres]|uniref:Uncharacterized protein n=1 Tax=Diaporthe vaccinii TaxID=105482 RepID=A0ABR4E179_9PEZI|nr:hypothetical protein LA080_008357 [Diaporthe eres]
MTHTSTTDEALADQWSSRDMISLVQSMIDEVERHVLQKEVLPHELIQGLYENINRMEAEILRRRTALSIAKTQIDEYDSGSEYSQDEDDVPILPVAIAHKDNNLQASLAAEQSPTRSQSLDGQSTNKDSQPAVASKHDILASLQDNIKAIQSIIHLRMSSSTSSKTRSTSSAVSFSILEEEMEVLDGLLEHVTGSSKPPNYENGGVLENKLMALPTQLSALFNTEIREVTNEGNDIDEQVMMNMVVENQKRVGVLRHIELVANKVKDIRRDNQDDESSGQQPACA